MELKKFLFLFIAACGNGVTPLPIDTNQCLPVNTCNLDEYLKEGPKGDKGEQGVQGLSGKDGKDAGPVNTKDSVSCSGIYYNYRFNYSSKIFSNGIRFVKCSAQSLTSEYASFDFNEYSLSDEGFSDGSCLLYGVDIDCHDMAGYWVFKEQSNSVTGVYVDNYSRYNQSQVVFQTSECVNQ